MPEQALIVKFPQHFSLPKTYKPPRKRLFYLGRFTYVGNCPGLGWSSKFWVKRSVCGTRWELFVTREESGTRRISEGIFSSERIKEYFAGIGHPVNNRDWEMMGWRGSEAEVVDLKLSNFNQGDKHAR